MPNAPPALRSAGAVDPLDRHIAAAPDLRKFEVSGGEAAIGPEIHWGAGPIIGERFARLSAASPSSRFVPRLPGPFATREICAFTLTIASVPAATMARSSRLL